MSKVTSSASATVLPAADKLVVVVIDAVIHGLTLATDGRLCADNISTAITTDSVPKSSSIL